MPSAYYFTTRYAELGSVDLARSNNEALSRYIQRENKRSYLPGRAWELRKRKTP